MSATDCGYCGHPYPGPLHDAGACHDHWRARAERAESEVARLRSAGRRLLDALSDHSCEEQGRSEELMLADAMLEDALATDTKAKVTPEDIWVAFDEIHRSVRREERATRERLRWLYEDTPRRRPCIVLPPCSRPLTVRSPRRGGDGVKLEEEWDEFEAFRAGPVDEAWRVVVAAQMAGKTPAEALTIAQDAYNSVPLSKATLLAILDTAWPRDFAAGVVE